MDIAQRIDQDQAYLFGLKAYQTQPKRIYLDKNRLGGINPEPFNLVNTYSLEP